jgi:hypothetical protein
VTAIKYRKACVFRQITKPSRQKIVRYVSGHVVIGRCQTLVKAIILVTVTISFLHTVAREIQKQEYENEVRIQVHNDQV